MNSTTTYFLKSVLGLRFVPISSKTITPIAFEYRAIFYLEESLSELESELVQKIAKALKMQSSDWIIALVKDQGENLLVGDKLWTAQDWNLNSLTSKHLLFGSTRLRRNFDLRLPHPSEMLSKPELKNKVWKDLQELFKESLLKP